MSEQGERPADAAAPSWFKWAIVLGLLTVGFAYFGLRWSFHPSKLEEHGQLGDALAPVAELLMLGALLAALYSAHLQRIELGLQRRELALQRREMKDARAEMVEQRKQLERSAKAQEALADAQLRAVRAQHRANLLALAATEVQLNAALSPQGSDGGASAFLRDISPTLGRLRETLDELPGRIAEESALERRVAHLLGEDPSSNQDAAAAAKGAGDAT